MGHSGATTRGSRHLQAQPNGYSRRLTLQTATKRAREIPEMGHSGPDVCEAVRLPCLVTVSGVHVGVNLAAPPESGGTYQYSLSVVRGLDPGAHWLGKGP